MNSWENAHKIAIIVYRDISVAFRTEENVKFLSANFMDQFPIFIIAIFIWTDTRVQEETF